MPNTMMMRGLYLVTPDWDETDKLLKASRLACEAGVAVLQYRHKTASAALRMEQATQLQQLCKSMQIPFIINDHIDLCLAIDADGVHVGGTDASVAVARTLLGKEKILGASCYGDLQLARDAANAGANYVAFGGFYPSRVKQYPVTTPKEIIHHAKAELDLPVCVIGGMTAANALPLVQQGADMVAAISSVYGADHPSEAAAAFTALFAHA